MGSTLQALVSEKSSPATIEFAAKILKKKTDNY